jgi:hypothetical protein
MPTKRYHKKSRAGCDTCKRRRVKCDEATPICGTCAQRGDKCSYSDAFVTTAKVKRTYTEATNPIFSSPGTITYLTSYPLFEHDGPSSRLVSYNATRMKELQLIHQWSTVTYMHSGPCNTEVFRDWVVKKSLEYSYLMDILLAFTSLHSASQAVESGEAYEHVTAALHYQNQSIAKLNRGQSLVRITQETCEPVVLITALNTICTLLASMVPATSGEQLESLPEVMLRTRRYMLGLNEVIEHCRSWAEEGELARIFMSPTVQNLEVGGLMTADRIRALCDEVLAGMDLDDTAAPFFRSMLESRTHRACNRTHESVYRAADMVDKDLPQR